MAMLWVLNLSDGEHTLLDIAERAGLPFALVAAAADLEDAGLLARRRGERGAAFRSWPEAAAGRGRALRDAVRRIEDRLRHRVHLDHFTGLVMAPAVALNSGAATGAAGRPGPGNDYRHRAVRKARPRTSLRGPGRDRPAAGSQRLPGRRLPMTARGRSSAGGVGGSSRPSARAADFAGPTPVAGWTACPSRCNSRTRRGWWRRVRGAEAVHAASQRRPEPARRWSHAGRCRTRPPGGPPKVGR